MKAQRQSLRITKRGGVTRLDMERLHRVRTYVVHTGVRKFRLEDVDLPLFQKRLVTAREKAIRIKAFFFFLNSITPMPIRYEHSRGDPGIPDKKELDTLWSKRTKQKN
jgi:hypothetical protein